MHIFLYNFRQDGKTSQIASNVEELRREESLLKYLSISSLHTDYLNLDRSSGSGRNNDRENIVQAKCTFCGGTNHPTNISF